MGDVVWTMSALMHNVSSGVGGHTPHSLHNLAEIVHRHPALLPQLQQRPYKLQIQMLFDRVCQHEGLYTDPHAVSQVALAQVKLGEYCPAFWHSMPEEGICSWNAQAASDVVYAYGKLHRMGIAPPPDDRWKRMQTAIVRRHAPGFNVQMVSDCAWSVATQRASLQDALEPLQQAAVRVAPNMKTQHVLSTLWAVW